jgi:hypothetical protein
MMENRENNPNQQEIQQQPRRADPVKIRPEVAAVIDSTKLADCRKCVCFSVCTIIRNFAQMTSQLYPKGEKLTEQEYADAIPVNPYELAKICKKYLPQSEIITR